MSMYQAERYLSLGKAMTRLVKPLMGIIAGCTNAMALLQVFMVQGLDKFVKNMKMREAGKCMRRWMEVVRERKWLRGLMSRCVGGTYFAMLGDGFEIWKNKL